MSTVTILFEGLCCHVERPAAGGFTAERRTILPITKPPHPHIPYIEMFDADIKEAANSDFTFSKPYPRGNLICRYVKLNDVRIELLNITSTSPSEVLSSFRQRIPTLQGVEPNFAKINPALLNQTIGPGLVAAYFDMSAGILSSGPSESFRTEFVPPHHWPKKHLGQWAQLDVEISGTRPVLRVTDLAAPFKERVLTLEDGADVITIGNQVEGDIQGSPLGVGGHFETFYSLSASPLTNPPKPKVTTMGLGVGCSNSTFP